MAINRGRVNNHAGITHAFSAGIKCRHCKHVSNYLHMYIACDHWGDDA